MSAAGTQRTWQRSLSTGGLRGMADAPRVTAAPVGRDVVGLERPVGVGGSPKPANVVPGMGYKRPEGSFV